MGLRAAESAAEGLLAEAALRGDDMPRGGERGREGRRLAGGEEGARDAGVDWRLGGRADSPVWPCEGGACKTR